MGFEPTTSELEVQRARPLRHKGLRVIELHLFNNIPQIGNWEVNALQQNGKSNHSLVGLPSFVTH